MRKEARNRLRTTCLRKRPKRLRRRSRTLIATDLARISTCSFGYCGARTLKVLIPHGLVIPEELVGLLLSDPTLLDEELLIRGAPIRAT